MNSQYSANYHRHSNLEPIKANSPLFIGNKIVRSTLPKRIWRQGSRVRCLFWQGPVHCVGGQMLLLQPTPNQSGECNFAKSEFNSINGPFLWSLFRHCLADICSTQLQLNRKLLIRLNGRGFGTPSPAIMIWLFTIIGNWR